MKKSKFLRLVAVLMTVALLLGMLPATALAEGGNELPIQPVLGFSTTPTTITAQNVPAGFQWHFVGETEWYTSLVRSGLYPNTEYKIEYISTANSTPTTKNVTTAVADYIKSSGSTSIDASASTLPTFKFGHSVDLLSSLNLRVTIPVDALSSYTNIRFYVQRQKYNTTSEKIEYETYIYDSQKYGIADNKYTIIAPAIAAAEMNDLIYITCYADDAQGKTYVSSTDIYSVKQYGMTVLQASMPATLKTLVVDMLNYGAAAQVHFNYETDRLANSDLTTEQKNMANTSITFDSLVDCGNSPALIGTTGFTSNSIVINDVCEVRYFFTLDSQYENNNTTAIFTYKNVKNENVTKTFKKSDFTYDSTKNRYCVEINDIPTTDMGCKITAVLKNNNSVISNEKYFSIETYCYRVRATTGLNDLCLALMRFSYSARAYFGN